MSHEDIRSHPLASLRLGLAIGSAAALGLLFYEGAGGRIFSDETCGAHQQLITNGDSGAEACYTPLTPRDEAAQIRRDNLQLALLDSAEWRRAVADPHSEQSAIFRVGDPPEDENSYSSSIMGNSG